MKSNSLQKLSFAHLSSASFISFFINYFLKILACFCIIALASCNKKDVLAPVNPPEENQGFKWLIVNDEFNWADCRSVILDVVSLQTESNLNNTLYVKTESNQTLLTYNTTMHEALQLKFDLPTDQNKVKIIYGSIEKIIDVINNRTSFDFITPIPPEYE